MDLETLGHEIRDLRDARDQLVTALTESIARFRTLGTSPPHDVLDRARRYRHQYVELHQRLQQYSLTEAAGSQTSLEDWDQSIHRAKRLQQITELLNEVEAWQVRGVQGPGPLAKVFDDIQNLRKKMSLENEDDDVAINDLIQGRHPLALVRKLVQHSEDLPDDVWTNCLDQVTESYGRELTTAISRGKVVVRKTESSHHPRHPEGMAQ